MSKGQSAGPRRRAPDPRLPVRASRLLRVRAIWVTALVVGSLVVAAMTALYIASATDPLAHLSGLPVAVVNQDRGATAGPQRLEVGQQIEAGLLAAPAVTDRLQLEAMTLDQAEQAMDRDGLYATLVIPPGLTSNLLTVAGLRPAGPAITAPQVEILINQRAGTVGTSLATGILQPALTVASRRIGRRLVPLVPAGARAPATVAWGVGMDMPYPWLLWVFTWLCAASVGIGTIALFAMAGNYGQLRLLAARGRLVEIGQFLPELDRLAVFEADFHPHQRPAAVCGGQLAVHHHPLDGGPVKQEFLPFGLGQLITVLVVVEQIERSSGGFLGRQYSRRLAVFLAASARVRL